MQLLEPWKAVLRFGMLYVAHTSLWTFEQPGTSSLGTEKLF